MKFREDLDGRIWAQAQEGETLSQIALLRVNPPQGREALKEAHRRARKGPEYVRPAPTTECPF